MNPIAQYAYHTEPVECTSSLEMPLHLVIARMLDAATRHALEWGVGYTQLIGTNRTWVLAKLSVEMSRMPKAGENLKVSTWIEGYNRYFSMRNYEMVSADTNQVLGYGRSIWTMIDTQTRTAVDLDTIEHIERFVAEKECPISTQPKLKDAQNENPEKITLKYSDIDMNQHFTSLRYVSHLLDLLPISLYVANRIKRFDILFIKEAYWNDTLELHHQQDQEEQQWLFEIRSKGTQLHAKAKMQLEKRK